MGVPLGQRGMGMPPGRCGRVDLHGCATLVIQAWLCRFGHLGLFIHAWSINISMRRCLLVNHNNWLL